MTLKTGYGIMVLFMITLLIAGTAEGQEESKELLPGLAAIARAEKMNVFGICEIYHGQTTSEEIQPCFRCRNTYSIAKLFVVTAIGILQDRGLLTLEEKVQPIFEDSFPEEYDHKWDMVTIRDVLQHRIGFGEGFLDIDAENIRDWPDHDFLRLVLQHPLKYSPGEQMVYSDAAFYLASRIVQAKSGERLDDFLIREVLDPLDFSEYAFSKCPAGYPIGATGMYIATEDMARLGQLYIQRGVWNGKRILSESFVEQVFAEELELHPIGPSGQAWAKGGMNRQLLYINRATERVIAIHSFDVDLEPLLKYIYEWDR